ncbi:MAG: pilus assembly PilX N-terminal domain-containing protein [Algiphilus sp.]|uniref:pilus assembly PilX family protein n=1 Tax=Algiphilus sp. TaxID=1872431 RepID=UPI0032EFA598
MTRAQQQGGFALITSVVLLIGLTVVGTVAVRNAGFELRMSENHIQRVEALENSELPRRRLGDIVDQHIYARGWPTERGGKVLKRDFLFDIPDAYSIVDLAEDKEGPRWYVTNSECEPAAQCALPATDDMDTKARFNRNIPTGIGERTRPVAAQLGVFKLRTDLNPGAGTAMVAGYEGLGKSAAAGGARILFHLESRSTSSRTVRTSAQQDVAGRAITAATYRHVVRN